MHLSGSVAEDPVTQAWGTFDAVAMPSKSRGASRWKRYLRELEDLPDEMPGLEQALANARRWCKQKEGEEANEE
jgi:hypothetical protein